MTQISLLPVHGSHPMTALTILFRLRDELTAWWEKRSYQPEKRYMRGTRDV